MYGTERRDLKACLDDWPISGRTLTRKSSISFKQQKINQIMISRIIELSDFFLPSLILAKTGSFGKDFLGKIVKGHPYGMFLCPCPNF
ncbi:hypothetical protein EYC80_008909 [Monilinia laxa]|uniref:Uncharacterized protein n=1 Tax=Monilinia laxa TaxID=61186 RepID=A0A5N6K1W1_MONLA|nr:hypothetical protein EYC80_008909 [Monilinia laxa]